MIKNKTVFVLGAGASKPYGYPTGEELFKEVLRLEKHPGFLNFLNKAFPSHEVTTLSGFVRTETQKKKTQYEFEKFIDELANSGLVSVDSFIEKRQAHSAFCKFAIAYLLLEREWRNPSNAALIENSDWYRYLFSRFLNGKSFEEILENNVSFITFNYDVSFDSFFMRSLVHQYPNCDRGKYFSKNPIIHMHGKVRTAEFNKIDELLDFTHIEYAQKVLEFSKNMNFYFESASTEAITLARKELSGAHNVFFLGFGFLPDNMEKLKINWHNNVDGKAINALITNYYGTALGLENAEITKIINDNVTVGNRAMRLRLSNCDCLSLIRQNVTTLK